MFKKFVSIIKLVFSKAPDTSTVAGRSKDRYRRAAWTTLSLVLNRVIVIATGLVAFPIALNYLGDERFGIWMTVIGAVTMLRFADMGIGSGLLVKLSAKTQAADQEEAKALVSSATAAICLMVSCVLIAFFAASQLIQWENVFNAKSELARSETGPTCAVVAIMFSLNMILNIVRLTHKAFQEGYVNNLWQCLGSVLGLLGMIQAAHMGLNMATLVAVYMSGPIIGDAINGFFLFMRAHPQIRPSVSAMKWNMIKSITSVGLWFLVMQIAIAVRGGIPKIAIANILSPSAVAPFAIAERVFSFALLGISMIVSPLWPAYSEARAKNEVGWMKKCLERTAYLSIVPAIIFAVFAVVFGHQAIMLITQRQLDITWGLLVWFGLLVVVYTVMRVFGTFLNGVGLIRPQAVCMLLTSALILAAVSFFTNTWGIVGTVAVICIAHAVTGLWYIPYISIRWFNRQNVPEAQSA